MVEKISVQIALEGTEEIKRQLEGVSEAGQKCFADISAAAAKAGGFDKLDPTLVTQKFQQFGISATADINKITAALQTAGQTEVLVTGVSKMEQGFRRASSEMSAFGAVATTVFGTLNSAFNKLGRAFTSALGPLAGAARALGPIGLAAGALAGGSVALVKFAAAAEDAEKALAELQKVSGQSIANLSAMANVFEQGGTKVKTFATEFGTLTEKVAAAGQAKLIREADQDWVKFANDIGAVRQKFDNLAAGGRETFSVLTTLDIKVQALLESLAKARTPEEQWLKLADIFRNLGSELERAQLGRALGLSPETIATLSQGSAALRAMSDRVKELGLSLDALDQKNLQQLIQSQNQAGALFDALKAKMGALVAPAIASFWQGFTGELTKLVPVFTQIAQSIGQLDFSRIGAAAADFLATLAKIAAGWAQILAGNVSFSDVLSNALSAAAGVLGGLAFQLGKTIGEGIINGIISAIQSVAGSIWNAISDAGAAAWDGITSAVQAASAAVGSFVSTLAGITWAPIQAGLDLWDAFIAKVQQAINWVRQLIGLESSAAAAAPAGGGDSGLPMASGGLIGGRGTGTSDSNLAWVSRGEHIMPARAVAQPGVLALLEALRRSGGNLRGLLDGMNRFALGGLVPRSIPAFADGGSVGARRVLNLNIEGRSFTGLSVPESTAQSLERFAVHSQLASTGRKPSWRR